MSKVWRIGRIVSGFALLVAGVIGLFLPILQGIAMIVGGLLLLAPEYRWAGRVLGWTKRRFRSARDADSNHARKANRP